MYFEKNLGDILNATNYFDDVCIINRDGYIVFLETKYPQHYGFDPQSCIGKHLLDVYAQGESGGSMYEVLKTGIPIVSAPGAIRIKNGKSIACTVNTFPILKDKEIIGVVELNKYSQQQDVRFDTQEQPSGPRNKRKRYYTLDDIVTIDPLMNELKDQIIKIAKSDMPILIYGATGTGKEVVAQSIHSESLRKDKLFISQNCAAVPENLLESIFFGTEKGAYTGAENRKGLFELAEGGTLFLDEINSMSVSMQVKLLKAIEEKKFRRIGGQREIKVDIRIISALNEDPLTLIAEKRLRPDLFYRLGNIYLTIPPLCERKGDIKHLTDYFMKEYQEALRLPAKGISDHVLSLFQKYSWPGNVRELKNALESALTVSTGRTIETNDLPEYLKKDLLTDEKEPLSGTMQDSSPDEDVPEDERTLREKLENYERNLIMAACEKYSTRVEAAKHLGISKQSLNYRLTKYKK